MDLADFHLALCWFSCEDVTTFAMKELLSPDRSPDRSRGTFVGLFPEDLHAEMFLGPTAHTCRRADRGSLKWNRVARRQVVDELGLDFEEVEGFRQSLGLPESRILAFWEQLHDSLLRIFDLHSNWAA